MQSGEKNAQPWLGKMQEKWGLETTRQVLLVLAVFQFVRIVGSLAPERALLPARV
jgi:hypothetical protein